MSATEQAAQEATKKKPVPVTVITGFLGSGKTSLVKHVLHGNHGLRIAVILNEVGEEKGIESAFIQDSLGVNRNVEEWVELSNGCLCCSVKNSFVTALEELMTRRDKFDYIIIETTGLANPGPVASALWTDDEIEAGIQLDGIITVVDAVNVSKQLNEARPEGAINEAQVQVAYADLVLLNKMDLADQEAIERAEADIRGINSTVSIVRTTRCSIDLEMLLHRNGYTRGAEVILPPIAEEEDPDAPAPPSSASGQHLSLADLASLPTERSHSRSRRDSRTDSRGSRGSSPASLNCSSHHGGHVHDSAIQTISLVSGKAVDLERFKSWVDNLLWDRETHPEDIYRMKGVVNVAGNNKKHSFQAVYELYEVVEGPEWGPGEPKATRVVVIGRSLNKDALRKSFAECTA